MKKFVLMLIALFSLTLMAGGGVFLLTGCADTTASVSQPSSEDENADNSAYRPNAIQWYGHYENSFSSYDEESNSGKDPGFDLYLQWTGRNIGSGTIYSFSLDKTTLAYVGDYTYTSSNFSSYGSGGTYAEIKVWASYGATEKDGVNVSIKNNSSPSDYNTSITFGWTGNGSTNRLYTMTYYRMGYYLYNTKTGQTSVYQYERYTATGGPSTPPYTLLTVSPMTGYTMSNYWYTNTAGTGSSYEMGATINGRPSSSLYARITPINYTTVTLNANGGSGGYTTTFYHNSTYTVTKPTRSGYTFLGYAESSSGTSFFMPIGASGSLNKGIGNYTDTSGNWIYCSSANNSLTLYARWQGTNYSISLSDNKGSFPSGNISATTVNVLSTFAPKTNYGFSQVYGTLANGASGYYYESQNKGVNNSYAMCKVTVTGYGGYYIYILNYAESNFDYAILSSNEMSPDETADSNNIRRSFKGQSSSAWTSIYQQMGSGDTFYIKFRKDGSGHSYNDSVRFYITNIGNGGTYSISNLSYPTVSGTNYGFKENSLGFYESQNKGINSSYALARVNFTTASYSSSAISFTVIKNCESYDHAYFGKLDTNFTNSASSESSSTYYKDVSDADGYSTITYTGIPVGTHFIYIKFYKDGSVHKGYDSLQFRVNSSVTTINAQYGSTILSPNPITDLPKAPTRSNYTFAGYQSVSGAPGGTLMINTSGTLVSAYNSTSNSTWYARWNPRYSKVVIKIYTSDGGNNYTNSTAGGSLSASYTYSPSNSPTSKTTSITSTSTTLSDVMINYSFKVTATAKTSSYINQGYKFMGFSSQTGTDPGAKTDVNAFTPSSSPSTTFSATYSTETTLYLYAYFKRDIQVKYDSKGAYVEYGYMPQTKVSSVSGTDLGIQINMGLVGNSSTYIQGDLYAGSDGYYYLKYNDVYYRYEPIKWRISNSWSSYNTLKGTFTLVSDSILLASQVVWNGQRSTATYGWGFSSSGLYNILNQLNKSNTNIGSYNQFNGETTSAPYETFAASSTADKVTSNSFTTSKLRVASVAEINSIVGSTQTARTSTLTDFAAAVLSQYSGKTYSKGQMVDYWTRDLGVYRGEGRIITNHGYETSLSLDQIAGVRMAFTISHATRFY